MSLFELERSNGEVSLDKLLGGEPVVGAKTDLSIEQIAEAIAVGGWPGWQESSQGEALANVRGYLDEVARADISRIDGKSRDPIKITGLLTSLARNVASHVSTSALAADAGGSDGPLDSGTVREYLDSLERLMVVESQPAWRPHLRSRRQLRHAPKRHFVDPSLAVAALRATPEHLLREISALGHLFESLVIRDLRIYGQACAAQVSQYRDSSGLEVDAIVEGLDRRWAAFEVKLNPTRVDEAAAGLLRFAQNVDAGVMGEPATLGVITSGKYGFVREDGIAVIPIGALGP
ncbi:MAG: DUF4143 domain-containing protein [Solirubrobacterales bacterium]